MLRYAAAIFLSASLLFQVQPLFGKFILPWFGGTPATWTTCMLCFQVLLFAGYAYAHLSVSRLTPRNQAALHGTLLVLALLFLPIVPSDSWKPAGLEPPVWRIVGVLAFTVGLPYLVLSSTTPLMQAWFARERPGTSPYRLYALSNLGSFLGLLSYPFVFEPQLTRRVQAYAWSGLFVLFAALAGWCAATARRAVLSGSPSEASLADASAEPRAFDRVLWLALPMCGSVMLLATTNEMSQDVAAVPFLWVVPLSLYLLSFTITFDSPRWYWRRAWAVLLPVFAAGAFMAVNIGTELVFIVQVGLYSAALFACCMALHGELARLKPGPRHLTGFFLMISGGGALGAVAVTLIAPVVFNGFYEFPIALMSSCALFAIALSWQVHRGAASPGPLAQIGLVLVLLGIGVLIAWRFDADYFQRVNDYSRDFFADRAETLSGGSAFIQQRLWDVVDHAWELAAFAAMAMMLVVMAFRRKCERADVATVVAAGIAAMASGMIAFEMIGDATAPGAVESSRSFYGLLRVTDSRSGDTRLRTLQHGHITHGVQRLDGQDRRSPTTYYSEESGIGVAIHGMRDINGAAGPKLRIGVVGLGAGTIAAYGTEGDYLRFYEINADVMRLNAKHFTFLKDSPARIEIALGDARIALERDRDAGNPQRFDVLAVDAFSGDAVPLHLLTREAFADYFYHLDAGGVLAMHISNRYLDLAPLVHDLAEDCSKTALRIENQDDYPRTVYSSTWILVTSNARFIESELVQTHTTAWDSGADRSKVIFTDDYANILRILRREKREDD